MQDVIQLSHTSNAEVSMFTERLQFRLSKQLLDDINKCALLLGVRRSDVIRIALSIGIGMLMKSRTSVTRA